MRNGARAENDYRRARGRQRTPRHDAPILGVGRTHIANSILGNVADDRPAARPLDLAHAIAVAAICTNDTGGALGRLATSCARLELNRQPQLEYVHADRA